MKVTAEAARRFLVARHFLAPAQSLPERPDAVLEVFGKLGSHAGERVRLQHGTHRVVGIPNTRAPLVAPTCGTRVRGWRAVRWCVSATLERWMKARPAS